jgi:hypothetical protein
MGIYRALQTCLPSYDKAHIVPAYNSLNIRILFIADEWPYSFCQIFRHELPTEVAQALRSGAPGVKVVKSQQINEPLIWFNKLVPPVLATWQFGILVRGNSSSIK